MSLWYIFRLICSVRFSRILSHAQKLSIIGIYCMVLCYESLRCSEWEMWSNMFYVQRSLPHLTPKNSSASGHDDASTRQGCKWGQQLVFSYYLSVVFKKTLLLRARAPLRCRWKNYWRNSIEGTSGGFARFSRSARKEKHLTFFLFNVRSSHIWNSRITVTHM